MTFILEHTNLCQIIDENRSTTPKHSYDQFETILKTSLKAAANEFSELSHLREIPLEKVCRIYSEEDWDDANVRVAALNKLGRELPMVIAKGCADERCTRNFLDYDIVERGAVDANVSSSVTCLLRLLLYFFTLAHITYVHSTSNNAMVKFQLQLIL